MEQTEKGERPRKEKEKVLQKYQPQAPPGWAPSSCVQLRKPLKSLPNNFISSVFQEMRSVDDVHK